MVVMRFIVHVLILLRIFVSQLIKYENDVESSVYISFFSFVCVNKNASTVSMMSLDVVFAVAQVFREMLKDECADKSYENASEGRRKWISISLCQMRGLKPFKIALSRIFSISKPYISKITFNLA